MLFTWGKFAMSRVICCLIDKVGELRHNQMRPTCLHSFADIQKGLNYGILKLSNLEEKCESRLKTLAEESLLADE
jgi:uncharacterized protein with von Willebrand factor type A (vWA) domain